MKKAPIHTFVLSIYPVLAMFVVNADYVQFSEIRRALLYSLGAGVLLFACLYMVTRNTERAGLLASGLLLTFFSYGHVYTALKHAGLLLVRHRFLLPIYIILLVVWFWLVLRRKIAPGLFLNISALVLLAISLYGLRPFLSDFWTERKQVEAAVAPSEKPQGQRPDVYYIILDSYGSQEMLQAVYDFDNSSFISELEKRGFYVVATATSNYPRTLYSLASSLNMEYLEASVRKRELQDRILFSRTRAVFANQGYQFVTANNTHEYVIHLSSNSDVDVVFTPDNAYIHSQGISVNHFEGLFLHSTILRAWEDLLKQQGKPGILEKIAYLNTYTQHRAYIQFGFEAAKRVPTLSGDCFTFIHIYAPHPPFVFGPDGEPLTPDGPFMLAATPAEISISPEQYKKLYIGQLNYVNTQILNVIDSLLASSDPRPFIIIQGDHGPALHWALEPDDIGLYERFSILNAYYFPDGDYSLLYPGITPVNSFRVVFAKMFGIPLEILPDRNILNGKDVTDRIPHP